MKQYILPVLMAVGGAIMFFTPFFATSLPVLSPDAPPTDTALHAVGAVLAIAGAAMTWREWDLTKKGHHSNQQTVTWAPPQQEKTKNWPARQ